MKAWFQVALLAVGLCSTAALAGPESFELGSGRDGALTVTAAGTVINRHARVAGPVAPGDNVLLVEGTEGFGAGDLVMVLQVTGLVPEPSPGLSGPVDLSRDAVGRWEFARLAAVGQGALTVSSPLMHSYAAAVTQVIRVPEYTHVRIQPGASIRAVPWNGSSGGVVAFLATGTVHNEGEISATGAGFRGGLYVPDSADPVACSAMTVDARPGAQKGEGVAVTQYGPTKIGREMVSNGGGGGVCPMAGGGGGGNGGAGGPGGGSTDAGANARDMGGQGGAKLVYSLRDHLSFGGGGGTGHREDWFGPDGGAGGGAIFIRAPRLTGTGFIVADGEAGGSSGLGGASGGGAGGSIYLRLSGDAICGGVSARGGAGGNAAGIISQAGEGGGGGGGRALVQASPVLGCPVSVAAGSNDPGTFSHTGMLLLPEDGVVEAPAANLALEPNKAFITSPAHGATVKNTGGPPIDICVTNASGECSGEPYDYELFINGGLRLEAQRGPSWTYTPSPPLSDGTYYVYVKAKRAGVTRTSSTVTFTVDDTEPNTFIGGSRPPSETDENKATFSFSSNEGGTRFECELDAPGSNNHKPYEPCSSPTEYRDLGPGDYTFSVRAIDAAGNVDPSPAKHGWKVVIPDTVINSGPDPVTISTSADFTFSAKNAWRYVCNLKRPGGAEDPPITNCTSPKRYSGLVDGTYVFSVHAVFFPGFEDPTPDTHTWTVDTAPPDAPTISSFPLQKTQLRDAVFEFSAAGAASYECALNAPGGSPAFSACTSSKKYPNLADGAHVFSVRALDAVGNKSSITKYEWMIDASAPEVKFLSPAHGDFVSTKTPRINGKIDDPFSRVKIYIDGVLVADVLADAEGLWSLPATAELSEGPHSVYVQAINQVDAAGNPSATNTFTVDTIHPDTTIIDAPPKSSNSRLAAFEFQSSESEAVFECQLDGAPYASCDRTHHWGQLGDGKHELLVRARDRANNVDSTPDIYEWFVIINAPPVPDIVQPADGASVDRDMFTITGRAVPDGTVTIYINGSKSGVAQTDASGSWSFRPPSPLDPGEYILRAKATDSASNSSKESDERVFTIFISKAEARAIGGGLSCASSGAHPASVWGLLGSGLWLAWYRRRSVVARDLGRASSFFRAGK